MTRLPAALRPWAPELARFPGDLAAALAGLAARMAQFLELAPGQRASEEVPDGYDGVTRRGPYERLLPSEWMWLDALPDEFLRRVISSEHVFFRRAHRQRAAAGRIVLLFDSGPDQLGGPRLVQLALAVVFARYARERGAELAWASLQSESSSLRTGFFETSALELIRGRTLGRVASDDVLRWSRDLGPEDTPWLVGTPHLLGWAAENISVVTLADVDDAGPARVCARVRLARRPGPSRVAVFELPERTRSVRLLRAPFAERAPPESEAEPSWPGPDVDPNSELVFSHDGRRLFVRGRDQTLITFPVPNSTRAPWRPPMVTALPPGHAPWAVGLNEKRQTVVVSRRGREVVAQVLSKSGKTVVETRLFEPAETWAPVESAPPLRPLSTLAPGCYVYPGADEALTTLRGGRAELETVDIFVSEPWPGALVFAEVVLLVTGAPSGRPWRITAARLTCDETGALKANLGADTFVPSRDALLCRPSAGVVAFPRGQDGWTIASGEAAELISVPEGSEVLGLAALNQKLEEARLIVTNSARTELRALSTRADTLLLSTTERIERVGLLSWKTLLAYVTQSGEVGIYHYGSRTLLLQHRTRKAAP